MTPIQREDLYIEWNLYEPSKRKAILFEYRSRYRGNHSKRNLFDFLADKLEIRGYWAKMGIV